MAEIIKTYKQNIAASRFIGKRYTDEDRIDGHFGAKWDEWFQNDWFKLLESQIDGCLTETKEDGDASIGLIREPEGVFEYWIGHFLPESTPAPEGFDYLDFPAGELGVCWIYGKEEDVFMLEGMCGERLEAEGYSVYTDCCFERYVCPRFTTPDAEGNIILDICFFVE